MSSRPLQCCIVHAAVVSLREHSKMWHGVCEPFWVHPYCHPSEEAHWGTALLMLQEPPQDIGCSHPTSTACLPEGFLRRPAHLPICNHKPHTHWVSFQFCFSLLAPFPRLWNPFPCHLLHLLTCSTVVPGSGRATAGGSPCG